MISPRCLVDSVLQTPCLWHRPFHWHPYPEGSQALHASIQRTTVPEVHSTLPAISLFVPSSVFYPVPSAPSWIFRSNDSFVEFRELRNKVLRYCGIKVLRYCGGISIERN